MEESQVVESSPTTYRSLQWSDLDKKRFLLFNPSIFFVIRLLQHPANVIKTRYQVQQRHSLYATPTSTLVQTLRHEGVRGLYRGFGTSGLMLVVQQMYITMYEFLRDARRYGEVTVSESNRNAIAAAVSVLLVQVVANPIDVVSQRLMLQGQRTSPAPQPPPQPPSATTVVGPVATTAAPVTVDPGTPRVFTGREVLQQVWRSRGMYGFYAGFFISCLQFIPSASLWWWSYPIYRDHLLPRLHTWHNETKQQARQSAGAQLPTGGGTEVSPSVASWMPAPTTVASVVPMDRMAEVIAGSAASMTVAVALNPMDIIRTRTQVEGNAAWGVTKALLATEGVRGLWKGTTARIAMLTPQGALTITAYELVKRLSAKEGVLHVGGDAGAGRDALR